MQVFKGIENLPIFENAVVTIGMFDGVHLGHQKVLHQLKDSADLLKGETVLITFDPHPRYYFDPESDLKLISTLSEKIKLLEHYGLDNLVIIPFDEDFANLSPESYIKQFLVKHFHPKKIIIGYDHKFGKNRTGNFDLLRMFSEKNDFEIEEIKKELLNDIAVNSTKIRTAINNNEITQAIDLLGHDYIITGKVVEGNQIGTGIGFPTANMKLFEKHKLIPPTGVYAVKVCWEDHIYLGMMNIGNRPTFNGGSQSIEVNIFNFQDNIYDEKIEVMMHAKVREEIKFNTIEKLIEQLNIDKEYIMNNLANIY